MQKGIIKNVNKLTGEPIDAKDLASMLSGIIGNESGVLTVFDELRLEKISDNKVRLHSGVYSLKGHILYIPKGSYEDFEIESGTLGANRIDLLVAEYVKNGEGDGEDTLRFRVIKGKATSGTPQEPSLAKQDINENGITYQEKLYLIEIRGVSISVRGTLDTIRTNYKLKQEIEKTEEKLKKNIETLAPLWMVEQLKDSIDFFGGRISNFDTISKNIFVGVWGPGTKYNPPEDYGVLVQFRTWFDGEGQPYITQLGFGSSGNMYFRRYWGAGGWSGWNKVNKTSV